jgi:hypothetical protein
MFAPKPHPDLHFESVGEVAYHMVSADTDKLAEVDAKTFIFAHFSPAFEAMHRQVTPTLVDSPISVGQSASVVSLLQAMGGAGYVLENASKDLVATGRFRLVVDAPVLRQPVYAAMHISHRISRLHHRLRRILRRRLSGRERGLTPESAPDTPAHGPVGQP